jgi:hypothetical protein
MPFPSGSTHISTATLFAQISRFQHLCCGTGQLRQTRISNTLLVVPAGLPCPLVFNGLDESPEPIFCHALLDLLAECPTTSARCTIPCWPSSRPTTMRHGLGKSPRAPTSSRRCCGLTRPKRLAMWLVDRRAGIASLRDPLNRRGHDRVVLPA